METNCEKLNNLGAAARTGTSGATAAIIAATGRAKLGHAKPLVVTIDLNQPGRLRVGHLMSLLAISHASLYARLREGIIPQADGRDGKRPYWKTATIKAYLDT
jgi:hypothetical protein